MDSWENSRANQSRYSPYGSQPLPLVADQGSSSFSIQPAVLVSTEGLSPPAGARGSGSTAGSSTGGRVSPCFSSSNNINAGCCENGRPLVNDPVTGQPVCSCQYDSARLAALSTYPRLATPAGVYGTPYPSTDQNPYPSIDSSTFYSTIGSPYGMKDGTNGAEMAAWTSTGLQTTPGYYHYDPTMAAYGYGTSYDLAARRKNATRESTATLKAWLNEHKKNPYPTKGEKIMLAIITKMTLTQVSTWFANARRRLKKENKMTWEPKNKTDDDEDTMLSDCDEKDKDENSLEEDRLKESRVVPNDRIMHVKPEHGIKILEEENDLEDEIDEDRKSNDTLGHHHHHHHPLHHHLHHHHHHHHQQQQQQQHLQHQQQLQHQMAHQHQMNHEEHQVHAHNIYLKDQITKVPLNSVDCGVPLPASKPKIWSLADTAACKTPPPTLVQHPSAWCASTPPSNTTSTFINSTTRSGFISPGSGPYPSNRYSYYGSAAQGLCGNSGGSLGFPDLQTDTPPQTPPNMKLPSVASNLVNGSSSVTFSVNTAHLSPPIVNGCPPFQGHQSSPYVNSSQSHSMNNPPQKDKSKISNNYTQQVRPFLTRPPLTSNAAHSPNDEANFKPFYKNVNTESVNGPFTATV